MLPRLLRTLRQPESASSPAPPAYAPLRPAAPLPPHLLANARVLPDRLSVLPLLPKGGVVVEVGVALGDFSEHLIRECDARRFIAIDTFQLHDQPLFWGQPRSHWFGELTHGEFYRKRFEGLIRANKVSVIERDSAAALHALADRSVDILYLDADHRYEWVARELSIIKRKMKPGGTLIMNDYIMADAGGPYGVVQATNEFMIAENWEMIYFALEPNMYCDAVLRKL